jgi:hypothetical protein
MANSAAIRNATTTWLSCSTAVMSVLFGTTARAEPPVGADAGLPPAAVMAAHDAAEPPSAEPTEPPGLSPPDGFDRRHRIGIQIGGTGLGQVVYRIRAVGPIHFEAGLMGADHVGNVSAGVLVGVPVANRWFPYVGVGGGAMWAFGPKTAKGCDSKASNCPTVDGSDTLVFLHLRAGVGLALGATRRHLVSLDVGGWYGPWWKRETDAAGGETKSSGTVTLPMAGLSYFFVF